MSWLPQSNATLLSISGGGSAEDYDFPEGADPAKWTGSLEIYVKETVRTSLATGTLNRAKDTRLILPGAVDIDFSIGDTVVYEYAGKTWSRKIEDWDDARLPGLDAYEVVHLHLFPADQDSLVAE